MQHAFACSEYTNDSALHAGSEGQKQAAALQRTAKVEAGPRIGDNWEHD